MSSFDSGGHWFATSTAVGWWCESGFCADCGRVNTGDGGERVGCLLVAVAPHPGLYDTCGWLMVCFVETVPSCERIKGALFAEGTVGAHFHRINGGSVYGLRVGEYGMTCAWWLIHTV